MRDRDIFFWRCATYDFIWNWPPLAIQLYNKNSHVQPAHWILDLEPIINLVEFGFALPFLLSDIASELGGYAYLSRAY
jgi:hypothetical protein